VPGFSAQFTSSAPWLNPSLRPVSEALHRAGDPCRRNSADQQRRRGSRVNYQIFSSRQPGAHLDYAYYHMYTLSVVLTWDEPKRQANLAKHGLDFADAEKVFAGPMVSFEDNRADYGEQRMIGVGLLDYLVVLIVHVEKDETIRIISMRKADGNETDLYYQNVGYF
jgi:hypothetical protein